MEPSIKKVYDLAEVIIDGNQLQTGEGEQAHKDTFAELLEAVDATLSLRLGGIPLEGFNPHYLEYRAKVINDFDEVFLRKPNALRHLREDLTRLNNHLTQAVNH